MVDRVTSRERGPALATLMMAFDIGIGLRAIVLGLVLEYSNFTVMYLCAGAVVLVGAGACAGATFFRRGR